MDTYAQRYSVCTLLWRSSQGQMARLTGKDFFHLFINIGADAPRLWLLRSAPVAPGAVHSLRAQFHARLDVSQRYHEVPLRRKWTRRGNPNLLFLPLMLRSVRLFPLYVQTSAVNNPGPL